MQTPHIVWMLICACLLIFMQLGFSCYEAGLVRAKNSINVVMKNCLDFCLSTLSFLLFGCAIMFLPAGELLSFFPGSLLSGDSSQVLSLLFHAMFCATAVTIISGAVVERMSLRGYLITSAITALAIYPLCGRLIWGDVLFDSQSIALLTQLGFHDFAGGTLVHSLGGAVALAAVLVIGPRIGRFGDDSQPIRPSSFPLASVGFFLLWVGWIGFNGGSQLMLTEQTPLILVVTILGGLSGLSGAAIYSRLTDFKLDVQPVLNGSLAGLVAITAGADFLTPVQSLLVGGIAGVIPILSQPLLEKWQIDDGVGVVPVHLFAGIWGTLATGLLKPLEPEANRFAFVLLQLGGSLAVVIFAFVVAWGLLTLAGKYVRLRVPAPGELVGLNIWEHRASTSQIDLLQQMSVQAELALFNHRVVVEPYTQEHDIATFYNSVLDKFTTLQNEKEQTLKEAVWLAQHDALTGVKNRRAITDVLVHEQERLYRTEGLSCIAILDLDDFKQINDNYGHDVGDLALQHFVKLVNPIIRKSDVLGRVGGEEFILFLPDTTLDSGCKKLEEIRERLALTPLVTEAAQHNITTSIGIAQMSPKTSFDEVVKRADNGLYQAKKQGKNCLVCL